MNKCTTQQFIKKSINEYGNRFDYSKTHYTSFKEKLKIRCIEHNNIFEVSPLNHFILKGCGCKFCGKIIQQEKLRKKDFKEILEKKYPNKYTILEPYQQIHKDIQIKCNIHNIIFSLSPYKLLKGGKKCKICCQEKLFKHFLKRAKEKWGEKFDYSEIKNYKNKNIKIPIRCNLHNSYFSQTPANHLFFNGCPECLRESQRKLFSKTTQEFIQESNIIHNGFYDYSKSIYINQKEKIEIICPEHGSFWVFPTNHLKGCDCQKCGYNKIAGGYFNKYFEKFPEKKNIPAIIYFFKFTRKSDNTFFYKLGISTKIKERYSSKEYKDFIIESIWEETLTLYQAWNYEQILHKLLKDYKYLPEEKFNGKTECYSINLPKPKFFNIFEHEWKFKNDIIFSRFNIKNHIEQKSIHKIPARKTKIKIVDKEQTEIFLNQTHFQGYINFNVSYGLFLDDELVSIMTFGKPRYNKNFDWELLRFSTKLNTIVVGGASKLFNFFKKQHLPKNIISYSDNRWNTGEVYNLIGLKFIHNSLPNYWYVKDNLIYSRIKCQKHKLKNLLDTFDPNKTEYQNMKDNNFTKIVDCGNSVYIS
jgi:hypothetical protein